jgi:hypothetical protein
MRNVGLSEWTVRINERIKALETRADVVDDAFLGSDKEFDELRKRLTLLENPPIPPIKGTGKGKKNERTGAQGKDKGV